MFNILKRMCFFIKRLISWRGGGRSGTIVEPRCGLGLAAAITFVIALAAGLVSVGDLADAAEAPSADGRGKGPAAKKVRHWRIDDPLFEELVTDQKQPFAGESCYIWGHPLEAHLNRRFALQYGVRYSLEETLAEYRRHRLHPYGSPLSIPAVLGWCQATGIGFAYYAPAHSSGEIRTDKGSFLYSPAGMDRFIAATKETLTMCAKGLWAVSTGDEVIEINSRGFLEALNDPGKQERYPYLAEAARDIRDNFGYGKYGPPSSIKATDEPYNHLAFNRWIMSRAVETQKRLCAMAKGLKVMDGRPPVVIGEDSMGGLRPYNYSRQAPYLDIVTGQQCPANNPWRQHFAFKVKRLLDLTGKPVWLCAHVENYPGTYGVEEVNEFLSEAVRVGGSGFQLWNRDHLGGERGTNDTRWDYYGHRERWDCIMDCVDRVRALGKLRFPDPDFAIFFSNEHCQSVPGLQVADYEIAFTMLGPAARTWFRFIEDCQVEDGKIDLRAWKAIILPKASIQRREISQRFLDYPRDGRSLVTLDPTVFSNDGDGSSTAEIRERLFGVKDPTALQAREVVLRASELWPGIVTGTRLVLKGGIRRKVVLAEDAVGLAEFEDGSPAIVLKPGTNGGRSIYFAFGLDWAYVADEAWRTFFKAFARGLGFRTDQDIWRFRFPLPTSAPPTEDKDGSGCLTGNHFVWWLNEAVPISNRPVGEAGYTYSIEPDAPPEQHPGSRQSFEVGDLTDRLTAPLAGNVENPKNVELVKAGKLSLDQFIVGWSKPAPVSIIFDLAREAMIERVRVFYSRTLPDLKVEIGLDGKHFVEVCESGGYPTTEDVLDADLKFLPQKARYARLTIGGRRAGESLILSEVEIWGR